MLLERLGLDRLGVVTHSSNLAAMVVRRAVLNNSPYADAKVGVLRLSPLSSSVLAELAEAIGDRLYVFDRPTDVGASFRGKLFVVGVAANVKAHELDALRGLVYLLVTDKGLLVRRLGLPAWRLVSVEPGVFLARGPEGSVRVSVVGNELVESEVLTDLQSEAYKVILDGMAEYGEMTVKDAVNIISARLGVSKERARELLGELVRLRMLKAEKGRIELY